jgi:hypothetical protein
MKDQERPGWVWAITIFYLGGAALLVLYTVSIHYGYVHLGDAKRLHWEQTFSRINAANWLVTLSLFLGTALLFYLRKLAFYFYCCTLIGNLLIAAWLLIVRGAAMPNFGVIIGTIVAPLILCLYSRFLMAKKILR